jgi:phosphomannomutase / phosphoglucomutase
VSIFKDCDIRGVYGPELNADTAYRLGRATGMRLRGRETVVGGDLRVSTPILKAALLEGLIRSGAHVIDLGILPTPTLYFAKRRLGAYGGIMVTASHNAAQYNGFKLMFGDLPITPEELQEIAQQMQGGDFVEAPGACRSQEMLTDYQTFLRQAFPGLKHHDLVVDAGNGSLSEVAPAVLRQLGQHVDALYCVPDGTFPHRDPNPAVPSHLKDLCQRVRATGAELGVAYDGDGDRVIFVDGRGQVLPADRTLVLLLRYLLQRQPGAGIVYDLKSSSVVANETLAAGGRPLMERSGHAFIKRRMLAEQAILAGEISGHYFFAELGGDDALYATLLLLRVLDDLGQTLTTAMDSVPAYPITPDLRLPCSADRARRILDEFQAAFRDLPIDTLDGVRVRFPHGWALARISVTEPLLTLRFEAHTQEDLAAIQVEVRRRAPQLDALLTESGLPSRKD